MQTETKPIDKSDWGDGPWQTEPDRVDFVHAGFSCMVKRVSGGGGHLCGYVGVPKEHPVYGKGYDDVDVEVHGGLTYADKCSGPICHVPQPGMPDDVWWLGFDCAHSKDLSPAYAAKYGSLKAYETYRTVAYVEAEVRRLAEQLAQFQRGGSARRDVSSQRRQSVTGLG